MARGDVAGDNDRFDLAGEVTGKTVSSGSVTDVQASGDVLLVPFHRTGPCATSASFPFPVNLDKLALGEAAVIGRGGEAGVADEAGASPSALTAFVFGTAAVLIVAPAGFRDLTSAFHSFLKRSSSSSPTGPSSCNRSRCSSSSLDVCSGDTTDMLGCVGLVKMLCNDKFVVWAPESS